MKKILALSLAAIMALSVMGCSKKGEDTVSQDEGKKVAVIESTTTYEDITFGYRVNDAGRYDITSIEYTGTQQIDVKLPSVIDGIAVTGIADEAFKAKTFIKSVEIPDSITKIGNWAFWKCSAITEIELPKSVTEIGKGAFWNCEALTSISLPEGLLLIDDYAFMNCEKLASITIPETVKTIGEGAFFGCVAFTEIVIPASVESIGRGLFLYCENLKLATIENAELVFPVKDDKSLEGVFVDCHIHLVIKAAADSTAKDYVDAMNEKRIGDNKIDFEAIVAPTPAE